jgi:competence protein ComEC
MIMLITIFTLVGCSGSSSIKINNYISSKNFIKVSYIDVNQGDSILVQVNHKNLLIDSGPIESVSKLMRYLRKQNIDKLDYVVATHPHEDHIGGMSAVIKKYPIRKFYAPKKITQTKTFENMVNSLKSKNLKIDVARPGINLDLGKSVRCEILAPISNNYENLNNYSAVIKITYGNSKFLFMGDAEKLSENELLENGYDLSCDILKIGHHGSSSSSSKPFLDATNPKIAIISCGKNNDYGHPHHQTLNELKKRKIQIYRTDVDGSVVFLSDGNAIVKE